MSLEHEVIEAFNVGGVLSRSVDQFTPRQGQTDMAIAVAQAIEHAEVMVVEASTGVGKTFAYLVPALLSGERVLLSTATKALQDQLFGRDLPLLLEALGLPANTALLKGRASYLCLHRLELARQNTSVTDRTHARAVSHIHEWSKVTRSGDLAELQGLDEKSPVIPLVTSSRENCLGSQCPDFRPCHVNAARREAMAADIVVVNHHLFFADLAVRESGMAELLPTVRIAIFDEAHQLNEIGVQFLGEGLTTGQLLDFCRDLLAAGLQFARGLVDWQKVTAQCEAAARNLRLCAEANHIGTKLRWTAMAPETIALDGWLHALKQVRESLQNACDSLDTVSEIAPDFPRLQDRGNDLATRADRFLAPVQADSVRWLEVGHQLRLVQSPLSIAKAVQSKMLGSPGSAGKSWVFTSATLGHDDKLTWFTEPCGLTDARVLRIESPFDYARQAALYIPANMPKPSELGHPIAVADAASRWATQLGGRTMVLTTTLKALRTIGDRLLQLFEGSEKVEVLVQGVMPKRMLIERFRLGSTGGKPGCLMVASVSFWEGIDIPGDALQLVVIDKLPFPPPNDPMAEARSRALEEQGQSAFSGYFLPEAAVALKQGAGRLIRRETDKGVLVICDTRLATMGYGRRLLKALPPMARLKTEQEVKRWFEEITKTCTKDFPPF